MKIRRRDRITRRLLWPLWDLLAASWGGLALEIRAGGTGTHPAAVAALAGPSGGLHLRPDVEIRRRDRIDHARRLLRPLWELLTASWGDLALEIRADGKRNTRRLCRLL